VTAAKRREAWNATSLQAPKLCTSLTSNSAEKCGTAPVAQDKVTMQSAVWHGIRILQHAQPAMAAKNSQHSQERGAVTIANESSP